MLTIGRRGDLAKRVDDCAVISSGGKLKGEELHEAQRFCISMWLRLLAVATVLFCLTGAIGAFINNFTPSFNHAVADVVLLWGGLMILSMGQVVLVLARIEFTYRALEKGAPQSYSRLFTAGLGLPRFYDFWIASAVSLGLLVMIFLSHQ
jgi:hypothetical protein